MRAVRWAFALSTIVVSAAACRGVLGIEDRTLADAGATPSCDTYCDDAVAGCSGANQIYVSKEQCTATCALFDVGQVSDSIGDSLGCRQAEARGARVGGEADSCQSAAIGGGTQCGGDECKVYCKLLPKVCPGFAMGTESECEAACAKVPRRPPFHAPTPDENSLECRLYHLANAALGPAAEHCPHAAGLTKCVDQNMLDGGDGGG